MDDNIQQLNIFNFAKEKKIIAKPIRLIELFSGIGAQAKALEILGVSFEHYKTCEWAYNSIKSYNAIHLKDYTDYSKDLTKEQLIEYLDGNISTNYNQPCNVKKQNEKWLRDTYNNCIATHNLMNIMKAKGDDVELVGGIGEKKSNNGTQYYEQDRVYNAEKIATAITSEKNFHPYYLSDLRIRKLTPNECIRLMGFDNNDYLAMKKIDMSDAAIYHCAGDSIITTCLMALFGQMLPISEKDLQQKIEQYVETTKEN